MLCQVTIGFLNKNFPGWSDNMNNVGMLIVFGWACFLTTLVEDKLKKAWSESNLGYNTRICNSKKNPLCLSARGVNSTTGFRIKEYEIELV